MSCNLPKLTDIDAALDTLTDARPLKPLTGVPEAVNAELALQQRLRNPTQLSMLPLMTDPLRTP